MTAAVHFTMGGMSVMTAAERMVPAAFEHKVDRAKKTGRSPESYPIRRDTLPGSTLSDDPPLQLSASKGFEGDPCGGRPISLTVEF